MALVRKYINYLFIFVVGWFGGSVFTTVHFLEPGKGGYSVHSSFNPQNWMPVTLTSIHYQATPAPQIKYNENKSIFTSSRLLPSFPLIGSNETDEDEAPILLDWPVDDKLFTHENYVALESLLANSPNSKFRILIPTSRDAYLHKIGNLFSTSQFRKYSKLGYDIEVLPVGQMEQSRGPGYGTEYWLRWMSSCCKTCDRECRNSDRVQPLHLLMYIRLCRLWRRGGMFSDFSFLMLGNLKAHDIKQGYFLKSTCNDRDIKEAWQEAQDERSVRGDMVIRPDAHHLKRMSMGVGADASASGGSTVKMDSKLGRVGNKFKSSRCVTSSLLVFNMPKSPAIECILQQYDNASFVECVERSNDHGAAGTGEGAAPSSGIEGALCLEEAFAQCFAAHQLHNDLIAGISQTTLASHSPSKQGSSVDNGIVLDILTEKQPQALLSPDYDWVLQPSVRAVWMGELAWEGHWRNPVSGIDSTKVSLLDTIERDVTRRLRRVSTIANKIKNDQTLATDCLLPCHKFSGQPYSLSTYLQDGGSGGSSVKKQSYRTGIEEASCAPSVVFVGFMDSAVSVIHALLLSHPQALPALGASVPNPYSSSSSQRFSCYRTHLGHWHTMLRPWCFPHIPSVQTSSSSESESVMHYGDFLSVDVDSRYAMDLQAPLIMHADNPAMKIVFVVRNPIERLVAHYMDIVREYPKLNFDDVMDAAYSRNSKFAAMRHILQNNSNPRDLISWYYASPKRSVVDTAEASPRSSSGGAGTGFAKTSTEGDGSSAGSPKNENTGSKEMDGSNGDVAGSSTSDVYSAAELSRIANQLFMQSIYLPPILHYGKVFGNNNIMIVNMDSYNSTFQMSSRRLESIAKKMHAFIGLCPHGFEESYLSDATRLIGEDPNFETIPEGMKIHMDSIRRLALFLEPFNTELSKIIGIDLSDWNSPSAFQRTHGNVVHTPASFSPSGDNGTVPQPATSNGASGSSSSSEGLPGGGVTSAVERERARSPYWFEKPPGYSSEGSGGGDVGVGEGIERGGLLSAGNSILRALFPPRHSVERAKDGGFNTTIGMLAMF